MPQTNVGSSEAGAGYDTGLADGSAAIIRGLKECRDREARRLVVNVAATKAFRLNYLFTPDNGATWCIGHTVTASTVTVDGGTSGYVKSATMDISIGYDYKIEIWNAVGDASTLNYVYELREYSESG